MAMAARAFDEDAEAVKTQFCNIYAKGHDEGHARGYSKGYMDGYSAAMADLEAQRKEAGPTAEQRAATLAATSALDIGNRSFSSPVWDAGTMATGPRRRAVSDHARPTRRSLLPAFLDRRLGNLDYYTPPNFVCSFNEEDPFTPSNVSETGVRYMDVAAQVHREHYPNFPLPNIAEENDDTPRAARFAPDTQLESVNPMDQAVFSPGSDYMSPSSYYTATGSPMPAAVHTIATAHNNHPRHRNSSQHTSPHLHGTHPITPTARTTTTRPSSGTLYGIPPASTVNVIQPNFERPPLPPPPYPQMLANQRVSLPTASGRLMEDPYRLLVGPISQRSREEWSFDQGKQYFSARLDGVELCEFQPDIEGNVYVAILFSSPILAEVARGKIQNYPWYVISLVWSAFLLFSMMDCSL
jgi:hypothetical protein